MMRRVILTLTAALAATFAACAADGGMWVDILLDRSTVSLGEPVDVTIRVTNAGEAPFVTNQDALTAWWLWPHLELVRVRKDGTDEVIRTDSPVATPPPPSWWIVRGQTNVAVAQAAILEPGASLDITLTNLVLYLPLVDEGTYRLAIAYDFPSYAQATTDPAYGEIPLVVMGEEGRVTPTCTAFEFTLELPDGVRGSDAEWFSLARTSLLQSRSVGVAVNAFAPPEGATLHVRACSTFWTGEAHRLYGDLEQASAAYHAVLAQPGETIFVTYAQRRLDAIAGVVPAQGS